VSQYLMAVVVAGCEPQRSERGAVEWCVGAQRSVVLKGDRPHIRVEQQLDRHLIEFGSGGGVGAV
jgi:hypothetical protein